MFSKVELRLTYLIFLINISHINDSLEITRPDYQNDLKFSSYLYSQKNEDQQPLQEKHGELYAFREE